MWWEKNWLARLQTARKHCCYTLRSMQKLNADFFRGNRERLKAALPADLPIMITANGLQQRGADSPHPFAQDANFWYLTGIDEPDVTLVMDGAREFLIVPLREGVRATFDGAVDLKKLTNQSGVKEIVNQAVGWKRLDELLGKTGRVATVAAAPAYIEEYGLYANPSRQRLQERLKQHLPELELQDVRLELARLRMIKQPAEIRALQKAIDITSASLKAAFKQKYTHEYQLEAKIAEGFRSRGAKGHSFEPIVAGGQNACTLHYLANQAKLLPGQLIICDVGAEYNHYAADITRTISQSKPTQRQKDVYQAVQRVQQEAMKLLKPGVKLKTYENKVATIMAGELKQLGLIKRGSDVRKYFPHATSHFLGLNVHDVGDYQQPLQVGNVLTVEPGIYIPEEGIGVRLEDNVLITEDGAKNLSAKLPQELW